MTTAKLGRDVFLALAAIGWADGNLDADEASAILRLAREEDLPPDEMEAVEAATRAPVDLGLIDRTGMGKDDRLFVYAVAAWMTRLDGTVTNSETERLAQLGDRLQIPERPRAHADAIALEIAAMPPGERPDRFDLHGLREVIRERLAAAHAARIERKKADNEAP